MLHICHVFDETTDWQHRVGASQLLDRLAADKYQAILATIDPKSNAELCRLPGPLHRVPRIAGLNLLAAPLLRGIFEQGIDLVHAWGPSAAAAAASDQRRPLVVELFNPSVAVQSAKILRAISRPRGFAIICSTQWIRRQLIENGVPAELCVVIRPGVDFALIQKIRKSGLRGELGVGDDDFVVVVPPSGNHKGSAFDAFWAGALLDHLDGQYKVIVTGTGAEVESISRFAAGLPTVSPLLAPGGSVPFERLVSIADTLVVPHNADGDTTAIAWAFGAGAAVLAAATYAVTELVVNKVNGLLYKHPQGKSAAIHIISLLRDRASQRQVKEAARGQAYEIFSLRRYADQHARVYENVLAGRAVSDGITDPAQMEAAAGFQTT